MNLDGIDMDSLNNIIGSLSPDDIDSLKGMAQSFFNQAGTGNATENQTAQKGNQEPAFDIESLSKIASIMSVLQTEQKDPRCDLLYALRPMLKEERQLKVDQAAKILHLFSLIPKIKELNL